MLKRQQFEPNTDDVVDELNITKRVKLDESNNFSEGRNNLKKKLILLLILQIM
jgi:hypothetical protein